MAEKYSSAVLCGVEYFLSAVKKTVNGLSLCDFEKTHSKMVSEYVAAVSTLLLLLC